jgi:hypothetical protein
MKSSTRERRPEKPRAELLAEIAALPRDAFIDPKAAASYLATTPGVLHSWREQRRGPKFFGANAFARYRICDLDDWMSTRAHEVIEKPEGLFDVSPVPRLIWERPEGEIANQEEEIE